MKINKKRKLLYFNIYKKHTLTHLSLLAYIWFTYCNSPFTVTAIIKIHIDMFKILQKTHLMSNNKYLSKIYILLRIIALLFNCAPSV